MTKSTKTMPPVIAWYNAGSAKTQAVVAILEKLFPSLNDQQVLGAIFLANAEHLKLFGRPVVGDTWIRGEDETFGVILRAVMRDLSHGRSAMGQRAARNIVSRSDIEVLKKFGRQLVDMPRENISLLVKASPLYGKGNPGSAINWLDGIKEVYRHDEEALSDMHLMARFGAF